VAFTCPRGGTGGCALTAICARGRNPVLAHAFVDHLLDVGVAMENFRWNGYQPPVGDEAPPAPAYLADAILAPEDLAEGRFLRPLGTEADARWRLGWQRFLASRASG
jgi:spermidine/putrescine transport system substrate-binding protein